MIIKGKLTYCGFGKTKKDDKEKYRLTVDCGDNLDIETRKELASVYENAVMLPKFIKDASCNTINLKSLYDIPVKCPEDENIKMLSDLITDGHYIDAEIRVSLVLKSTEESGAIYPKAIVIDKLGSKYDTFSDFN